MLSYFHFATQSISGNESCVIEGSRMNDAIKEIRVANHISYLEFLHFMNLLSKNKQASMDALN
jgi:hypothetical protein